MFNNKILIIFLIGLSCLLSISLSAFYIHNYDSYQLDGNIHIMLKEETLAHWYHAANIIEQVKNGTSFYIAGEEMFTKPLPQRLVALYAYFTNFNIIDDWENNKISLGGKLPFLIIQSLVYYLSIYFLYSQISKYFSNTISFLIIIFLCLEPTIFQYHSSFWTESIFFSLQIILLSIILKNDQNKFNFFIIGLILGILFIQRSAGIFYIFIVIIYYFISLEKEKLTKISLICAPFILICFLLGMHNLKRADIFYVMPTEGKYVIYKYFAKVILAKSENKTSSQINESESKRAISWIKKNLPEIDSEDLLNEKSPYEIGVKIKEEKYRYKYYNYLNKRAYEIIFENPLIVFKKVITGFLHFSVLNPFFVYFDYEFYKNYSSPEIGDFVNSEKHKQVIPSRIIYSIFIYLISFIGLIISFKKQPKITLLLILSILYYYIILGWYGKTRLFVPTLIYMSFFFGHGASLVINFIKKKLGN
ncbi:glycosyltransferase family 39 protein [Candidatus Pelagibacter sp.]|nr:glycosyltransferase family 39 protein [Candidatus Pelagibacter sp.]